jgi:hypothetical protein
MGAIDVEHREGDRGSHGCDHLILSGAEPLPYERIGAGERPEGIEPPPRDGLFQGGVATG